MDIISFSDPLEQVQSFGHCDVGPAADIFIKPSTVVHVDVAISQFVIDHMCAPFLEPTYGVCEWHTRPDPLCRDGMSLFAVPVNPGPSAMLPDSDIGLLFPGCRDNYQGKGTLFKPIVLSLRGPAPTSAVDSDIPCREVSSPLWRDRSTVQDEAPWQFHTDHGVWRGFLLRALRAGLRDAGILCRNDGVPTDTIPQTASPILLPLSVIQILSAGNWADISGS